jgi:hypothetical protein|tara:strand:+ start:338 stop:583 length:246 start_codon:yes stop_codon:yes gene_type:complete
MQEPTVVVEALVQTPKKFSLEIENIAKEKRISHMDAVLDYCQKNEIEPDTVGRLITKGLKEKIEANARELNYLEKQAQLPI